MNTQLVIPDSSLPDWIRTAKRGFDWGWLLVAILSLAIGWSFIVNNGLSTVNANASYGFRAADTAQALREGDFYPRWSPHAIYAYGAPIPDFYPPLASYLPALISVLLTNDVAVGVRVVYLLGLMIAGTATYRFMLNLQGARTALIAALLYVYSPVMAFTLPHQYGDLAAFWGAVLMPVFLICLDHVQHDVSVGGVGSLAATLALLLLADPLVATPTALILGAAMIVYYGRTERLRLLPVLSGVLGGFALSAFYWLPALLEAGQVGWQTLDPSPVAPMTLLTLFQPFSALDPAAMLGVSQNTVGLALTILLVIRLVLAVQRRYLDALSSLFLLAGAGLGVSSVAFQVPQLVAGATFCAAIGCAPLVVWSASGVVQRRVTVTLFIGVLILSLPLWISQRSADNTDVFTAAAQLSYEQRGLGVAVLPQGAPIPGNVRLDTPPNALLLNSYASGIPDRVTLEGSARDQLALLRSQDTTQLYSFSAATPLNATYIVSAFPGWQATLDDRLIPLQALANNTGYALTLSATRQGDLRFVLGSTTVQQTGWLMAVGGVGLIVLAWARDRRRHPRLLRFPQLLKSADLRLLVVATISCTILMLAAVSDRLNRPLLPQAGSGLQAATMLHYRTDTPLQLLAMQLDTNHLSGSSALGVMLYWETTRPLADNYKVSLTLQNVLTGGGYATTPAVLLGGRPSRAWDSGLYTTNLITMAVPPDLPEGRYTVTMNVFPCGPRNLICDESAALTFFDPTGIRLGNRVTLPQIINRG